MNTLLVSSSNENNALNPYIEFEQESFQENVGRMLSLCWRCHVECAMKHGFACSASLWDSKYGIPLVIVGFPS